MEALEQFGSNLYAAMISDQGPAQALCILGLERREDFVGLLLDSVEYERSRAVIDERSASPRRRFAGRRADAPDEPYGFFARDPNVAVLSGPNSSDTGVAPSSRPAATERSLTRKAYPPTPG